MIIDAIAEGFTGLMLVLDALVYWLVSLLFELYQNLASFQFLTDSTYQEITERFFVIIGVIMLFYLTYALLKALVNPDELSKNTSKIVLNLVISLALINIVPIIFNYSFTLQDTIISEGIIPKIIYGDANDNIAKVGRSTAMTFLEAFLKVEEDFEIENSNLEIGTWGNLKTCIIDKSSVVEINGVERTCPQKISFLDIASLSKAIVAGDVEYTFIISTACGIFLAYVILSFCIDLGIRAVKLGFYQIISPIPILMRIIPEKKSVFDNWVKATFATYLEVFIRLFIMYLITFLCTIVPTIIIGDGEHGLGNGDLGIFGTVIVLMGIFAFAKQAPKLIGDVIGVNAGNIKLGIKDKLAEGGAFMAASAVGSGVTSMTRNLANRWIGKEKWQNKDGKYTFGSVAKNIFGGLGSGVAGGISGAVRSGYGARNAKTYADVKKYASEGAAGAINSRDKREAYKASHGGTLKGVAKGHIDDIGYDIKNWATGGTAGILGRTKFEEEFKNSYKEYEAIYENPKYNAMKSQLQQYEALKASGVTTYEGKDVSDAIKELKGNMLKARLDSMRDNTQSTAYAMYNIAQLAKKNPVLSKEIGLDVSMADDLVLKGNVVYSKSSGEKIKGEDLFRMIEGSALNGITYDGEKYVDANNMEVNLANVAKNLNVDEFKNGMSHQKKTASDQLRNDQLSIEYKEAQKKKQEKK